MSSFDDKKQIVKSDKAKLSMKACDFVKRVHAYFVKESENNGFLEDPNKVYLRTAMAARITRATVARIMKEREYEALQGKKVFKTPGHLRPRSVPKHEVTCFTVDSIRQRIYDYYLKSQLPCMLKLVKEVKQDGIIKTSSHASLRSILYNNGFIYKRYSGRKVLLERDDIVIKRCQFFKKIKNVNLDDVLWVGETSFPLPLKKSVYVGRVYKLIIFHAGTRNGFLKKALLVRPSTIKSFDYEKEISTDYFQKWFDKVLEEVPVGTDIVLNVTPCHNAVMNKPPNLYSDKQSVINWLNKNNVRHEEGLHKAELLDMVRLSRPIIQNYCLEHFASEKGYNVIRVPPYHNHFNSLEIMWFKIKNIVNCKVPATYYDATTLEQIVREAIDEIKLQDWTEAVECTKESIIKAQILEAELETGIESVFKQIDATKKSGREELEYIKYHDDMSDLSEYFTESSGDENNSDLEGEELEAMMYDNQTEPHRHIMDSEITMTSTVSSDDISSSISDTLQSSDNGPRRKIPKN